MQSLEVFQITVEEGIFVVPFDLKRNLSTFESPYMVHFM